ncbi:MAG TPA: site-specific integrase [Methylocella sp.]|jgi:integrase
MRAGTAPQTELSESELWLLAQEWLHYREKQDDTNREIDPLDAKERLYVASDPNARVQAWLQTSKLLREREINLEFGSPSYERLTQRIREAMIEAEKRLINRFSGESATLNPRFANVSAEKPPNVGSFMTFEELLTRFRREQKPGRSLKAEPRRAMQDDFLKSVIGAKTLINSITRDDARRVRDAATSRKAKSGRIIGAGTARAYLYAFSAAMTFAENEGLIHKSPATKLRIANDDIPDKDRKKALSAEDIAKILNAPLFQGCRDDARHWKKPGNLKPKGTRFWVIMLALFTGARGNEILQLTEDDIECIGGIHAIHIRKQVKKPASRRTIPIHSELIRLGFLDYVADAQKRYTPKTRIFPDVKISKSGYYSDYFGIWFALFKKSVGITDPQKSFHSFRHSFEDAAKEANISQSRIDALLGHKEHGMAGVYGSGFQLSTLAAEMEKIHYRLPNL